jgi:hypothetical protein
MIKSKNGVHGGSLDGVHDLAWRLSGHAPATAARSRTDD